MRRTPRVLATAVAAALVITGLGTGSAAAKPSTPVGPPAADGPGAMSHFGLARKDCLGTARNSTSKVWFTVAGGVLSDVYYPTVDNTNNETLQFVVTDGSSFTDLQTRDMTYTVRALDDSGMACRVTSTAKSGKYTLTTDYFTDPQRNSVVMRTRLKAAKGNPRYQLYARFDGTINGNGGGGDPEQNAGADDAMIDTSTGSPVPVSIDTVTATTAANRDYATPVYAALRADRPFLKASSGFVGTPSDGLAQLDASRRLTTTFGSATQGNVVQTAQLDVNGGRPATLALGFGADKATALATAGATARTDAGRMLSSYQWGWKAYDKHLNPPASPRGLSRAERKELARTYWLSANVLKASEDKTFAGAIVASLASPWGQAVAAGDPAQTYFGSYREVFARDLYETFTGLLASGDVATARSTVRFLFERQQQPDGSMPRNSLINGKLAPDSFGVQLDEVAYPILMARTVGLTDKAFYEAHIKRAADYVVARGPSFGNERWEEQSGYSPSTIAAEIAGLAAAGAIAQINGDAAGARIYRATADFYQRNIKAWTVTTTGTLAARYFIRLSKTGDPNAAISYNLGNGGPDADQRSVIDAGFLELPRLGILPADDPDVANTLPLVDDVIGKMTDSGQGYYRYGVSTPGTEDGYGDCNVGDPTDCTVQGKPWAGECGAQGQNKGSGHLWPVLAGERAEHEIATGNGTEAVSLWQAMSAMASGVGLIPEQAWENEPLAASPFGTQPECASIGFENGKAAGSASPLTWSAATFVRLSANIKAGRILETPKDTTKRYIKNTQTGTTLTITAPADNATSDGPVTITGSTEPGSKVDVVAVNIDGSQPSASASTTAAADGSFSLTLTPPFGTTVLTVTATTPSGATGFAQRTVINDIVPGTKLLDVTDPAEDDNGPGTYAYPTSDNFQPGAYDLRNFQVYEDGADVIFRVQTADLTPTFGSSLGAQLVDVYITNPAASGGTSTAASYPGRNYSLATPWNRLIEVQGFGQRFVNADKATLGTVAIRASAATRYITFTVPKEALGGTPGTGWTIALVLTGQDGFSPDQARGFQPTAQDFQFGVCTAAAVAANNPICAVDPATVPKAVDILTPDGVSQADELNPLAPPVVIQGITIP